MNKILQGDCLETLKTLPNESVDMVLTSPPYWGLRDYGVDGQLGNEKTYDEYVTKLCDVFDEIKRVLKKTGSCWVNIGDVYSGAKVGNTETRIFKKQVTDTFRKPKIDIAKKSLLVIPFRFVIEMVDRGWILRNTIIWHKPSCMPQSVKDRFTVDYEYLFFFVKNKDYYFEQQFEELRDIERMNRRWLNPKSTKKWEKIGNNINPNTVEKSRLRVLENGRNKRSVWSISPKPFLDAHFAVYPEKLCVTPIKAGCPEGGVVLDPFFGAGTTGLVAKKLRRNYIGIELNPEYIEIANKRLSQEVLI